MSIHNTKEWKQKADEFKKGKVCEWCSADKYLHVHHPQGGETHPNYILSKAYHQFKCEYSKKYPRKRIGVPSNSNEHMHDDHKGHSTGYHPIERKHKRDLHSNADIKIKMEDNTVRYVHDKSAPDFKQDFAKWKVEHNINGVIDDAHEKYLSLDGCVVLCRKCHYAVEHGKTLCPVCKSGYKSFRYEMCFNCLPVDTKSNIENHLKSLKNIEDEDMECDSWFEELNSALPERKKEMLDAEDKKWETHEKKQKGKKE